MHRPKRVRERRRVLARRLCCRGVSVPTPICTGSVRSPPAPRKLCLDADARFSASCGKQRRWTRASRRADPPTWGLAQRPSTPDAVQPLSGPARWAAAGSEPRNRCTHGCPPDCEHTRAFTGQRTVSVKTAWKVLDVNVQKGKQDLDACLAPYTETPTRDAKPGFREDCFAECVAGCVGC